MWFIKGFKWQNGWRLIRLSQETLPGMWGYKWGCTELWAEVVSSGESEIFLIVLARSSPFCLNGDAPQWCMCRKTHGRLSRDMSGETHESLRSVIFNVSFKVPVRSFKKNQQNLTGHSGCFCSILYNSFSIYNGSLVFH